MTREESISRQAALASIKNLYPDMPIMDIFGARRKWLEKYAPYFECENAIEQLPPVNQQEPCNDVTTFKENVLDAISRIGLHKSDTKEVQAVAECLRAVEALPPVKKDGFNNIDKCRTCKHAFTTGKDRWYCKKSLADKDDCGEYEIKNCEEETDGN